MGSNAISAMLFGLLIAFLAQLFKARGGNWKKLFEDFPQNWKIPPCNLVQCFLGNFPTFGVRQLGVKKVIT